MHLAARNMKGGASYEKMEKAWYFTSLPSAGHNFAIGRLQKWRCRGSRGRFNGRLYWEEVGKG